MRRAKHKMGSGKKTHIMWPQVIIIDIIILVLVELLQGWLLLIWCALGRSTTWGVGDENRRISY